MGPGIDEGGKDSQKQGWKQNNFSLCVHGTMIGSHMQMKLWRES